MSQPSLNIESYQKHLNDNLRENGLFLEPDTVFPVSLTPYFMSEERYNKLASLSENVIAAIEEIIKEYVDNPDIQKMFPELENYRFLSTEKIDYNPWIQLARFDIVETPKGDFQLMETNCACPGGISLIPRIKSVFQKNPLFPSLIEDHQIIDQPIDDQTFFVRSMVETYKSLKGKEPQTIAFINSKYHTISTDMKHLVQIAKDLGYDAFHAYVQDVEYADSKLSFEGKTIDLVHHKFDAYLDENGQDHPCLFEKSPREVDHYLNAISQGDVVYINPLPSMKVAENKRMLALLHNSTLHDLLTDEQKEAIDELVPPSFCLSEGGQELLQDVKEHKDKYVIKKVLDTRSRGVYIGKELSQSEWEGVVTDATDSPYIVQEYLEHVSELVYPNDASSPIEMKSNIALYLVKGKAAGLLCRAAPGLKSNFYASGILRPVYIQKG
jgi:uncharacterized circularly permuted ATP-grasp superfamily protein